MDITFVTLSGLFSIGGFIILMAICGQQNACRVCGRRLNSPRTQQAKLCYIHIEQPEYNPHLMITCPHCGVIAHPNDRYCANCRYKLR